MDSHCSMKIIITRAQAIWSLADFPKIEAIEWTITENLLGCVYLIILVCTYHYVSTLGGKTVVSRGFNSLHG